VDIAFRRATRSDSPVAFQLVDRALRDYGLYAAASFATLTDQCDLAYRLELG
jgi:hypothetical protein